MAGTSKSEPPCRREHDSEVLSQSRKNLYFELVLLPPFSAFGVSYSKKHSFQECLILVRFLDRLLHHFKHPKWFPNHTFLAWEREARLTVRVSPTLGRSFDRLIYGCLCM